MIKHQFKLKNFPPVFVVSVKSSTDRRKYLKKELDKYHINNVYYGIFDIWSDCKDQYLVTGNNLQDLHIGSYGPVTSHILINKYWIENTSHEYVIVMEDDTCFDFVKYWDFTWSDFYQKLPEDWELVQLSIMREFPDDLKLELRSRYNKDLGCQIYLIKRDYAERVVSRYHRDYGFDLSIPPTDLTFDHNGEIEVWHDCQLVPYVENIMYESIGRAYSCPLFFEKVDIPTLAEGKTEKEYWRQLCYDRLLDMWKNHSLFVHN
jgi:GR25 family glycosyltransferase involved in LPS biosynthesis